MSTLKSNTLTILFADVADSSRLYQDLGDEAGHQIVTACIDAMSEAVAEHGGRVVDQAGDEIMCVFPSASRAQRAALEIHARVGEEAAERSTRLRVRIGLAHGVVQVSDKGFFGDTVYLAHRLVEQAGGGHTLTNMTTLNLLPASLRIGARLIDNVVLKGRKSEESVYRLASTAGRRTTLARSEESSGYKVYERALITYGEGSHPVDRESAVVLIGRDEDCHIRVRGKGVSGRHAQVKWDRGRIWIRDTSTNGTLVEADGRTPVELHNDLMELKAEGTLHLVAYNDAQWGAQLRYRCIPPSS